MIKKVLKKTQKITKAEYNLIGKVGWWVLRSADPNYFRGEYLEEQFKAPDDATAVKIAREKVNKFLEKNKNYSPLDHEPKDNEWDRIFDFSLTKIIWEMDYTKGEPEEPAIPKKSATLDCIKEIVVE